MTEEVIEQEESLAEELRLSKVLEGLDDASDDVDMNTIVLSTGVILGLKPVSKWLIKSVNNQFTKPEIPMQIIPEKGLLDGEPRREPNPSSPKYLEAMEDYLVDISNATTDVCILRGTEISEKPEDMISYDSEECELEMQALGFQKTDNLKSRYVYWVKYIAAPLDNDMNLLMGALGRLTGISEADVLEAVVRFRSSKK